MMFYVRFSNARAICDTKASITSSFYPIRNFNVWNPVVYLASYLLKNLIDIDPEYIITFK